ncbi:alpha/beta hydrolase [Planococcus liqunii]|uniref:Alpha/beta hydrolase n=1 Tax=Planococcus liqunii TaxID=3058394 RepID=A0ABT8MT92_9BACL|nr:MULTISPECIES: alpha/beta hydrolase [unclassified Planococcus (in: firmicutes)]MDN7228126.1 alpha/beta hydrolase [Planococcus sp. N064]WKA49301.1 alpha/beta hydrolase [Planococcus sp. N056]
MKKQILFVHSAGPQNETQGSSGLIRYLEKELGGEVELRHPAMPDPENPVYADWERQIIEGFTDLREDAILIGHSLGGSALLKLLSEEKMEPRISALLLIASPVWGMNTDWDKEDFLLAPGFSSKLPENLDIFLFYSAHDNVVAFKHGAKYAELLPSARLKQIPGNSHLFENGLPELVEEIKRIKLK